MRAVGSRRVGGCLQAAARLLGCALQARPGLRWPERMLGSSKEPRVRTHPADDARVLDSRPGVDAAVVDALLGTTHPGVRLRAGRAGSAFVSQRRARMAHAG